MLGQPLVRPLPSHMPRPGLVLHWLGRRGQYRKIAVASLTYVRRASKPRFPRESGDPTLQRCGNVTLGRGPRNDQFPRGVRAHRRLRGVTCVGTSARVTDRDGQHVAQRRRRPHMAWPGCYRNCCRNAMTRRNPPRCCHCGTWRLMSIESCRMRTISIRSASAVRYRMKWRPCRPLRAT